MSANAVPLERTSAHESAFLHLISSPERPSLGEVRAIFWTAGVLAACVQAWVFRYQVSADSISYLDMSDGALPGFSWYRLISGVWSPLYPLLLGVARRVSGVSASQEIAFSHWLNVPIFVFAFGCFEVFLYQWLRLESHPDGIYSAHTIRLPNWSCASVAYALFLWSSLSAITLRFGRPDMLMSGFVYLAVGALLEMRARPARWSAYLGLGTILGVGYLAKAPMLPIGLLILLVSLIVVENWRPALKMAIASGVITLLIGSAYFVPLSLARGQFTLGKSGAYNYLVNVDRAGSAGGWYMEHPGHGAGAFAHPPTEVFSSPSVYVFGRSSLVTHPLRFDPSEWMDGVLPRFALKRQIGESLNGLYELSRVLIELLYAALLILAASFFARPGKTALARIRAAWPVWMVGIAGCAMYVGVHVESRYVGAFIALFCCGLLSALKDLPYRVKGPRLLAVTVVVVLLLLLPITKQPYRRYWTAGPDPDAEAAADLDRLGIRPGDRVGRISSMLTDLSIERIARVEVIGEVDYTQAKKFLSAPIKNQKQVLSLLASAGAKAVIATAPELTDASRPGWRQLGSSRYWVWMPTTASRGSVPT